MPEFRDGNRATGEAFVIAKLESLMDWFWALFRREPDCEVDDDRDSHYMHANMHAVIDLLAEIRDGQSRQNELLEQWVANVRARESELFRRWSSQVDGLELRAAAMECELERLSGTAARLKKVCFNKPKSV